MTATPSSEVAIGRWMKGDETLMDYLAGGPPTVALRLPLPLPRGARSVSARGGADGVFCPASSALDATTCVPSVRRANPVVPTLSPACTPDATTDWTPSPWPTVTR